MIRRCNAKRFPLFIGGAGATAAASEGWCWEMLRRSGHRGQPDSQSCVFGPYPTIPSLHPYLPDCSPNTKSQQNTQRPSMLQPPKLPKRQFSQAKAAPKAVTPEVFGGSFFVDFRFELEGFRTEVWPRAWFPNPCCRSMLSPQAALRLRRSMAAALRCGAQRSFGFRISDGGSLWMLSIQNISFNDKSARRYVNASTNAFLEGCFQITEEC